jgi:hypothetical protein
VSFLAHCSWPDRPGGGIDGEWVAFLLRGGAWTNHGQGRPGHDCEDSAEFKEHGGRRLRYIKVGSLFKLARDEENRKSVLSYGTRE